MTMTDTVQDPSAKFVDETLLIKSPDLHNLQPGNLVGFQDWYSLPQAERNSIDAGLQARGLKLLPYGEEQFEVDTIAPSPEPATVEEDEEEVPPLTVEQIQEILKKHLRGEVSITPTRFSSSDYRLLRNSTFNVSHREDLGTRVPSALRCIAGKFLTAAIAIEEVAGYSPDVELYTISQCDYEVGFGSDNETVLLVSNASDEEDAVRQARAALEQLTGGLPLQALAPRNAGPVRLEHVNTDIFEFVPAGIYDSPLEGCRIAVDSESTRQAAEVKALQFIEWVQAQSAPQHESAQPALQIA